MDTVDIVYYTCLNNDCAKHRNVFVEGDPQHEGCSRQRLWLEGERQQRPVWVWVAAGIAAAAAAGIVIARTAQPLKFKPPMLRGEAQMQTWSGGHAHRDDREGNRVPPPIA